jgi:hypothetical protein
MLNQAEENESIVLLVSQDEISQVEGQRGWGDEFRKRASSLVEVEINVSTLEKKMASFLTMVGRLFQQAEQQTQSQSMMQLSEVELSVEISAKGEVKLVAGSEVSGKGAIKLKFVRLSKE